MRKQVSGEKGGAEVGKKWQLVGKCGKIVPETGKSRVFRQIWPNGLADCWSGWRGGHNRQEAKSQNCLSSRHDRSDE